jgi:hypothetical protein
LLNNTHATLLAACSCGVDSAAGRVLRKETSSFVFCRRIKLVMVCEVSRRSFVEYSSLPQKGSPENRKALINATLTLLLLIVQIIVATTVCEVGTFRACSVY